MTTETATVTRYVGNCQICEADQKLHVSGKKVRGMVHHGYSRPGDGMIHGDCPGVGCAPYEVSCEDLKEYRAALERHIESTRERIAAIEAGKVTSFRAERRVRRGYDIITEFVDVSWEGPAPADTASREEHRRYFDFRQEREGTLRRLQHAVRVAEEDVRRCTRRIDAWKPAPIRTVEEKAAEERAAVEARQAERAAARAVRDAKKAETRARVEALQARRQAEWDAYEARILAAAALPEAEKPAAVEEIRRIRDMKKNAWMWHFDLSPAAGEAVKKLPVESWTGYAGVIYFK